MLRLLPFVFLASCVGAAPVTAQSCAPRPAVVERLSESYGESQQAFGIDGGGQVVETFANLETGSWSVIVTRPGGLSCLVASGQAFELTGTSLEKDGDPT